VRKLCFVSCFAITSAFGAGSLRVDTNLVLVPVSVTDAHARSVIGLEKSTFHVFDGNKERPVVQFTSEDQPVSIGIVFDASASMADKIEKSRMAVAEFINSANPEDEFFLLEFRDRPELTAPFTSDPEEIRSQLATVQPQGHTALVDSLYLALDYMSHAHHQRKAILVISDGGENGSRYAVSELRRLARERDVWIYAIGIYGNRTAFLPEEEAQGPELLAAIAEPTGGREVPIYNLNDLTSAAAQIGRELRNQYMLGYVAPNQDGKYHRIVVKAQGRGLRVTARSGYYAAGDPQK
jgi:VWFA-related protein